jgi:hypothetical protein
MTSVGPIPGKKECRECAEWIPEKASLCSTCKSYQNWKRFISLPTTSIALLTALISVLTVSIPQLVDYLRGGYSTTAVSYDGIIAGKFPMFTISNGGNRPSTIEPPKFGFVWPDKQIWYELNFGTNNEIGELSIPPSQTKQLVVSMSDVSLSLFNEEARKHPEGFQCGFLIQWVEFGDKTKKQQIIKDFCGIALEMKATEAHTQQVAP